MKPSLLARIATAAAARPRRVLFPMVLVAVAAAVFSGPLVERLSAGGFEGRDSESYAGRALLEERIGARPDSTFVALVESRDRVTDPRGRRAVARVEETLDRHPAVKYVTTAFSPRDPRLLSRDRRSTYVVAYFRPLSETEVQDAARELADRFERLDLAGATAIAGGTSTAGAQLTDTIDEGLARAELFAFPILFLLLLWTFRGVVAALLPLLVAFLSVTVASFALGLMNEAFSLSIFALNLILGLGLGLAVDYSLLIVSRYREERLRTESTAEALARTAETAGRTVLFSAVTVAAAMATLLVFPLEFLYSMGIGGVLVTALAALIALTVLPAILAMLGPRIDSLAPRWAQRAAAREARAVEEGRWYRLARAVLRRPAVVALATTAVLLTLGAPFLRIDFTLSSSDALPRDQSARQVADRLERDFPRAGVDPIMVLVEDRSRPAPGAELRGFARRIDRLSNVAGVHGPQPVARGLWQLDVTPRSETFAPASADLVDDIRGLDAPFPVTVTGEAANFLDLRNGIRDSLPLAVALLVATSLIALFLLTGSAILPLKTLVMSALSLSAALGILVLIFQDARLEGLLGYESSGAIEVYQPVLIAALAFGLATDYGVFLLARIKEAHDRGAPDAEAVAIGIGRTGRIVTAAALTFCVAIGALAATEIVFIKQLAVGTVVAVLIDATIVRALLVPALMGMLGRRNWWAPGALRRLHGRLPFEHPETAADYAAPRSSET